VQSQIIHYNTGLTNDFVFKLELVNFDENETQLTNFLIEVTR